MKRLISIVLALIMALPFGAVSCFAVDGSNNGSWKVEDSDGKNISIYVYTDGKKPDSSSGEYLDLIKFLVYAGIIGFVAYEFGRPVVEFAKAAQSTWNTVGGMSKNIIIGLDKAYAHLRHPIDAAGAYWNDYVSGNIPQQEQTNVEQFFNEKGVPHPENMTNAEGVVTVATNAAGAVAVAAGAWKAATWGASLGKGQRVRSMCEIAEAGVLGLGAILIAPVTSGLTALAALIPTAVHLARLRLPRRM